MRTALSTGVQDLSDMGLRAWQYYATIAPWTFDDYVQLSFVDRQGVPLRGGEGPNAWSDCPACRAKIAEVRANGSWDAFWHAQGDMDSAWALVLFAQALVITPPPEWP
jgi:hypothetical protein